MRTAVRAIFYRIVGLYILSLFMVGLCVRRDNENLLRANAQGAGNAAQSPFVVVIKLSGVKVLDHIINAVILTSAFSSGNEFLYASSRALFMLSQQGQAPRIFGKILPNGVPIFALGTTALFSLLAFLSVSSSAEVAFNWLANITTLGSQITWTTIAFSWIRFNKGMKRQGVPRSVLPFASKLQPYGAWACATAFPVIMFFAGWTSVKPFSASDFFSTYVNLIGFALLVVGWKLVKKTKYVNYDEMDVSTHYVEGSVVVSHYK
jgi:amino acid transporter